MKKLLKELRRRQVFRASGLYLGATWIVLQVADIVLPAYDAPDWAFRALISVAIVGFPIAVWLSWVFDLTSGGLHQTADLPHDSPDYPDVTRARKADFVVIAVLLVALSGSLFFNFSPDESSVAAPIDPVSLLIADFANTSGDAVFDDTLEQVLTIGLEESSFITTFDRNRAHRILMQMNDSELLDQEAARLVSVREGVQIVVSGALSNDGSRYNIDIEALHPGTGEVIAKLDQRASDKTSVMAAVGELARGLREELGDANVITPGKGDETFTTIALDAMSAYVKAQRLAVNGKDEQALGLYRKAVEIDPDFGRAWSGLALCAHKLGDTEGAETAWAKALGLMETMTERERYRTSGVYYSVVARNSHKAIENYSRLIEKFPADGAGLNNLAIAYFLDLQFDKALDAGRKVVDIYPGKAMYRANYSLYAMYASDFDSANEQAAETLKLNPNYHKAYLPYAVSAMANGEVESAVTAYENMSKTGPRGESLAATGLADLWLWRGDAGAAEEALVKGIESDTAAVNNRSASNKQLMLALAKWQQNKSSEDVVKTIDTALGLTSNMSNQVQAALLFTELGERERAQAIADSLSKQLDTQKRAYGKLINALLLIQNDETATAVDELQSALNLADIWLVRYHLGIAYAKAGHHAEAEGEFQICQTRLGEAYSLFFNDTPTFRYTADLASRLADARNNMTAKP